jgi:hypothetical protein
LSRRTVYSSEFIISKYIRWRSVTHLDALSIHFIVLFGFRPIQPGIAFLVDEQIRPIDLLEFQFDRGDELGGDEGGSLSTYTGI